MRGRPSPCGRTRPTCRWWGPSATTLVPPLVPALQPGSGIGGRSDVVETERPLWSSAFALSILGERDSGRVEESFLGLKEGVTTKGVLSLAAGITNPVIFTRSARMLNAGVGINYESAHAY